MSEEQDRSFCCMTRKPKYVYNNNNKNKHFQISKTIRNVTKYGNIFTNNLEIKPVYGDRNGEIVALLAVLTGKMENNKKLLFEIPFSSGIEGIKKCDLALNMCMTNPQPPYHIIWVNLPWVLLTQFSSAEAVGQSLNILQQWELHDVDNKKINKEIAEGLMSDINDILFTDEYGKVRCV